MRKWSQRVSTKNGIDSLAPPTTHVLSPNGGEYVKSGELVPITWTVDDEYLDGVRCSIAYNTDSGQGFWNVIDSGIKVDDQGNGSYNWRVPASNNPHIENDCRIRVIANDTNNQQGVDKSDADFTIEFLKKPDDEPEPNNGGSNEVPEYTGLQDPFPNPFNPTTSIRFDLKDHADVTLLIYNINGRVVKELRRSEPLAAGRYVEHWDGSNNRGNEVSAGVYFLRFIAGEYAEVKKIVLIK